MNAAWSLRYISIAFLLLAVMASLGTYHPDIQIVGKVLPPAFVGISLFGFAMAARLGRLPYSHWIHRSNSVKDGLVAAAVTVTLLLFVVG